MANEKEIQNILYYYALNKSHWGMIPNCSLFLGESDFLSMTKANFAHEYEIKCSKADFKRDFKDKKRKHSALENGRGRIPNYFWFVTAFDFKDVKIPKYAGHIKLMSSGRWITVVKNAPRLHKKKLTTRDKDYVLRGLSFRYWTQRMKEK